MELTLSKWPAGGPKPINPAIARARELVLRFGWNSTSFQIVNPGFQRWFSGSGDAVIGYMTFAGVRVVAGGPVCPSDRVDAVRREFEEDAHRAGEHVCYFGAEERLEHVAKEYSKFLIGAQPVWDPRHWSEIVRTSKSLRAQINRAKNKGVLVTEWPRQRASDDPQLTECLQRWLSTKCLPPLHFLIEPNTLSRLDHRRIFVAAKGNSVVGFIVASPIANRHGWLFEQFPHVPEAPNGTVELMIDAALRTFADENCEFATIGLAPLSRRADVPRTHDRLWLRLLLTWARKHGQRFYNFDGLDAFKAKLRPDRWEPVYCIADEPQISITTLYAITGVFTAGHPYSTLLRGLKRAAATELKWLRKKLF